MFEIDPGSPLGRLLFSIPRTVFYQFSPKDNYHGYQDCEASVIPPGMFTEEEIEELRNIDAYYYNRGQGHIIANFLPDHLRPRDVEKM